MTFSPLTELLPSVRSSPPTGLDTLQGESSNTLMEKSMVLSQAIPRPNCTPQPRADSLANPNRSDALLLEPELGKTKGIFPPSLSQKDNRPYTRTYAPNTTMARLLHVPMRPATKSDIDPPLIDWMRRGHQVAYTRAPNCGRD
ncbi:hypothetical protein PSACC_01733 [Paramicrosporidium saccamoebae]|uniref:Uncharacterized protein n=1 Tax=Paramicrosporidium saccamoebae TaxID=1246581 RepID=A0A2H9TL33_9FUNG|nr:hypothetical protein PSACC_01733 [Paramicrosporidium saccamoebae]